MADPQPNWRQRVADRLLDLDARVDTAVFHAGQAIRSGYARFSDALDEFRTRGVERVFIEACSEGATLLTVGLLGMLTLAVPAFRETRDDDWLKRSEIAVTFQDRYGNDVGSRGIRHNDSVPLEELPDHLIKAVLSTEDRRFYEHFGIDFAGTMRAVTANAKAGGVVQGGSSLSQQLAKNLFLSNERTFERKIKEAFLALWLESRLTKNQILKLYLDRAYMGAGTFGVDAAARFYFGKSARDVNLAEAAMLAGLFKAPTKYAPHVNLPAARARARTVLDNLVEAGFMTEGQVFAARRDPATSVDRRDERSPDYYLDWAFDELKSLVDALPNQLAERVFVVRTGLDLSMQRQAESVVETMLRDRGEDANVEQAALVLMDLDGAVRAMVGGRDYGDSQFNRATDALRQPGSSFKPYVYAAALERGFKPTSVVRDEAYCIGTWCPQNYGRSYAGNVTLTSALARSINTVPLRLAAAIGGGNAKAGRADIIALARKLGLRKPLADSTSLPIGAAEVSVLDHTAAYTVFPNGGTPSMPHAIVEIRNGSGATLWRADRDLKKPGQALRPQTAADMNFMMNKVVEEGTGKRALLDGVKAAGKTGTTNGYRDAWFVGYTGNFVCGVWFGNDDYSPMQNTTGGSLPAMTWQQIMTHAHKGVEAKPIPGVAPGRIPPAPKAPVPDAEEGAPEVAARPFLLGKRSVEVLRRLEQRLDAVARESREAADAAPPQPRPSAELLPTARKP